MKARVLPLDSDEHRRAQELLPWFVNGTLDADEAAPVAAHLAQCARCRDDAREQAALQASAGAAAHSSPEADRSWASLRSRLETGAERPLRVPAISLRPGKPGLRVALMLQSVVIVALAIALVVMASDREPYRAMGAQPPTQADAVVVFRPDATNQQMRAALGAAHARIVGGPTATDAYLLRLGDAAPDALARLRAQPGVVTVESLRAATP